MSIAWNYLDKRSAAMAALKDYRSMKAILATTAEEIANVRQDMVHIGGMRFEESAHGARNPQAGENQILRTPLSKITSTGEIEQRFRLN